MPRKPLRPVPDADDICGVTTTIAEQEWKCYRSPHPRKPNQHWFRTKPPTQS